MAATLCHRSGDSLSYTASAFSNSLFSAGVHFELLLSWSRPQLGGRISVSHFITSQFTMHQLILKPINSPKPRRSRSFVYWLRLLYMFFFFFFCYLLQIANLRFLNIGENRGKGRERQRKMKMQSGGLEVEVSGK